MGYSKNKAEYGLLFNIHSKKVHSQRDLCHIADLYWFHCVNEKKIINNSLSSTWRLSKHFTDSY